MADVAGNQQQIHGTRAHDAVDGDNPVKTGTRAVAHGASPTAVAAGDRADDIGNRHGVRFGIGGHPNAVTIRRNYTAAQTDTVLAAVASGLKGVVTRLTVTADKANTVDVAVRVGFGASTTPSETGVVAAHPGGEAGGGFTLGDGSGILGVGGDDQDLRLTSEIPTGGSLDVTFTIYLIES